VGLSYDFSRGDLWGMQSGSNFNLYQAEAMLKHQFSSRTDATLLGDYEKYNTNIKNPNEGNNGFTDYKQYGTGFVIDETLSPMTTASLTGNFKKRNYPETKEKTYTESIGKVGLSQKITPRISAGVNGGYSYRSYNVGAAARTPVYGADLDAILSNFSTLHINYTHEINDTFYPKDAAIINNPFPYDETESNLLNENWKYMKTDRVGLNLDYRLTEKDSINLGVHV